jgi:glyoxylate/hydroxypyruvate reductase
MALVYKADPARGAEWKALLAAKSPDLAFHLWPEMGDTTAVRYLATWIPPDDIMGLFPNLELVMSIGAGVDQFDLSKLPGHLPLVRMLEPGIVDGMVEYVTLGALALHRHLLDYAVAKAEQRWQTIRLVPAAKRRIGVLGCGQLGQAVCRRLAAFGFAIAAWSRSPREVDGVTVFTGRATLPAFLARTDILVCLLPLTKETDGILDAQVLGHLPRGAGLINTGRGRHLIQDDLRAALDSGQLSGAVLDVADPEPLPSGHWLWSHPRVILTPHVASMTQPETAVDFVLETIARHRQGLPLRGLVDRKRGY